MLTCYCLLFNKYISDTTKECQRGHRGAAVHLVEHAEHGMRRKRWIVSAIQASLREAAPSNQLRFGALSCVYLSSLSSTCSSAYVAEHCVKHSEMWQREGARRRMAPIIPLESSPSNHAQSPPSCLSSCVSDDDVRHAQQVWQC